MRQRISKPYKGMLYSSSVRGVLEFCLDECSKNYLNSGVEWKIWEKVHNCAYTTTSNDNLRGLASLFLFFLSPGTCSITVQSISCKHRYAAWNQDRNAHNVIDDIATAARIIIIICYMNLQKPTRPDDQPLTWLLLQCCALRFMNKKYNCS